VNRIAPNLGWALLFLFFSTPSARAQLEVGDDLRMNLNGLIEGGYSAYYGDAIPSTHGFTGGGNAELNGSYYSPNFLNFTVVPYYNQSRTDSNFQSLTAATGVAATANFFTGSRFPGYASYHYDRDSTGTVGLIGTPNFTAIGTGQGFGIGWSALLPDWPTFSVSYSQGTGNGTLFGTNQESYSSTKTLTLRSTYQLQGWRLSGSYDHLKIDSTIPYFLTAEPETNFFNTSGNEYGISANHDLPWHGSVALSYNYASYSGDSGFTGQQTNLTNYTTQQQTAVTTFHPTVKLGLFFDETYMDNLNGFAYQSIVNNGGGIPLVQLNSQSNSVTFTSGANYTITRNLYSQAQVTYYDQNYFGKSYQGSYFAGTIGYGRRIFDIFTVSASVIESTNQFANNSLGFIGNLNAFHHFGPWDASGNFSYAQNVQTILVTYTTSYYNYGGNLHRRLGNGMQWTVAFNGSHTGFSQQEGTVNQSEGVSSSLTLPRLSVNGNYIQSKGQSVLTSTGIQPITTPGFPAIGIILFNGKSYGGGITLTPLPRLSISGNYSRATSDTVGGTTPSNNRSNIFYSQLQYRLRQINLLAGYTKFTQGISAYGLPAATQYSYFIGVTRYLNFF
jgi:hypothetical protein